jgi:hypothetical protein
MTPSIHSADADYNRRARSPIPPRTLQHASQTTLRAKAEATPAAPLSPRLKMRVGRRPTTSEMKPPTSPPNNMPKKMEPVKYSARRIENCREPVHGGAHGALARPHPSVRP